MMTSQLARATAALETGRRSIHPGETTMATAAETFEAALKRYLAELDRVDPEHEDGNLGASINQDARYAVDSEVRSAARAVLDAGQAFGKDTSRW